MKADIVNGRAIAMDIQNILAKKVSSLDDGLQMDVLVVGDDAITKLFVSVKKRFAEKIGISFRIHTFTKSTTTEEIIASIDKISEHTDGIVVQLPLPQNINTSEVLNAIPMEKDIDVLSNKAYSAFSDSEKAPIPPVVGAVRTILDTYKVALNDKNVVIIGRGRLVGEPVEVWCKRSGASVVCLDSKTVSYEFNAEVNKADIIISGAGSPDIVTADMVKEGVVLIDAGTSTRRGTARGDIASDCIEKASIFSQTPGGVGPLTVAHLFRNLVESVKGL